MSDFYSSQNSEVKTIQERCREYYALEDFVVIMNVDVKPFQYMVQRPENVIINQPNSVTKELYYKKDPEVITLQPGQTRLVPAYEADIMIKALIDAIVMGKRRIAFNRARSEGMTEDQISALSQTLEHPMDPTTQNKYIREIFQGKQDLLNSYNQQASAPVQSAAEKDLELDEPTTETIRRSPGRPKKQVA